MDIPQNKFSCPPWKNSPVEMYTGDNFSEDFLVDIANDISPTSNEDLSLLGHEILLKNLVFERIILPNLRKKLDWSKINMGLLPNAFNALKEEAINQITVSGSRITLKLFADFDEHNTSKVKIICNNIIDALLLQNLFRTPTKKELNDFDKEDYLVYVSLDPNFVDNTGKTVNINVQTKEIVIRSGQYLETMDLGIFFVINQLLFNK